MSTVAYGLWAAPAGWVEYQTQDQEQACDPLQQPAYVENTFLHDALHTHGEDGHQGHRAENEDAHGQEDSGGLPEAAGDLAKTLGVGPAQRLPLHVLHARVADAAGVDAQGRVVGLRRASAPLVGLGAAATLGFADEPVGAHEGDELCESHHDTQEGPEHGATGDNNMTHIDVAGGEVGTPRGEQQQPAGGEGGSGGLRKQSLLRALAPAAGGSSWPASGSAVPGRHAAMSELRARPHLFYLQKCWEVSMNNFRKMPPV